MDIAQAKRRENIAEYILYLWQLEDLLRALQFSPEAIFSTLIAPRKDIADEQKHVFLLWYMDIANLLHQEGKDEKRASGTYAPPDRRPARFAPAADEAPRRRALPQDIRPSRTRTAAPARRAGQSGHERHGVVLQGLVRRHALSHQGRGRKSRPSPTRSNSSLR